MCSKLGMALHPKYLHYWDQLDKNDLRNLLSPIESDPQKIVFEQNAKKTLEKIGIPHTTSQSHIVIKDDDARILYRLLYKYPISISEYCKIVILSINPPTLSSVVLQFFPTD